MELGKEEKVLFWVEELNQYFGLEVTVSFEGVEPWAWWDHLKIVIPLDHPVSPQLVAHEYSHIVLGQRDRFKAAYGMHGRGFRAIYREACRVLGVEPFGVRRLRRDYGLDYGRGSE